MNVGNSERNRRFVGLLTTHPFGWTGLLSNERRGGRGPSYQHRNVQFRCWGTRLAQVVRAFERISVYSFQGYVIWAVSPLARTPPQSRPEPRADRYASDVVRCRRFPAARRRGPPGVHRRATARAIARGLRAVREAEGR